MPANNHEQILFLRLQAGNLTAYVKYSQILVVNTFVSNMPFSITPNSPTHLFMCFFHSILYQFNRNARKYYLDQKCCKKRGSLQSLSSRESYNLLRHIIVDKENKFLYCYVPKVASSNIKRMILTIQGRSESADAIKHFDQRGFEFLSDFSILEREHIVKTFYKFVFVRNPLFRLVSAYRNKFQQVNNNFHLDYGRKIVKRYRTNSSLQSVDGDDVTFQEFVKYVIDEASQKMNEHWMPMYDICQPCVIQYDFVGSFEFLDIDVKKLLQKLNVSSRISLPKKQIFYQQTLTKKNVAVFYRNITADEFRSVHRQYIKDFKCFGYGFLNTLQSQPRR